MITIKQASASDIPALRKIENNCFTSDIINARQMRYLLTRAKTITWIAYIDRQPAAYCMCLTPTRPRPARLYSLAVAPEHRGNGLARRLMETMLKKLKQLNYSRCRLEVETTNTIAYNIYKSLGFYAIASLPGYYENGATATRMETALRGTGK